jgi:type VI secretion system protein ImpF
MDRNDAVGPVTLSVLDRLIDDDPKVSSEVPMSRTRSLRELRAAVRRDLEWLLNTRKTIEPSFDSAPQTANSVYEYGLKDLSSRSVLSNRDQIELVREMEVVIAAFEPRLHRVKIRLSKVDEKFRSLNFTIEGLLCMDPAPEAIRFDTSLDPGKWTYEVKGQDGAR